MWIEIWQRLFGMSSNTLSNILLTVTAVILLFTLFAILGQLRTANKSSQAQFGIHIMNELRTEEWRNRFKLIYQAKDTEFENDEIKPYAEFALDKFEWVGVMLNERVFSTEIVMKLIEGLPIRVWYKLDGVGFIKRRREKRGHYARYAEYFTKKSIEYQIKCKPMGEWTKLDENDKIIKLVNTLVEKKFISSKELRWLNFYRQIHAITNKKLNYGYPLEYSNELEDALKTNRKSKVKKILTTNEMELGCTTIIILNPSKLCDNKLFLKLSNNEMFLKLRKDPVILKLCNSKLCDNKWISKLRNNKWKIISGKKEHVIVKSDDKMYECKSYEIWYRKHLNS